MLDIVVVCWTRRLGHWEAKSSSTPKLFGLLEESVAGLAGVLPEKDIPNFNHHNI